MKCVPPRQFIDLVVSFEKDLASFYEDVADTYRMISNKFKSLADDERQHHDYIRQEQGRLEPAIVASPPDRNR